MNQNRMAVLALQLADEAMAEVIRAHTKPFMGSDGGDSTELRIVVDDTGTVQASITSVPEILEAFAWLRDRGIARVENHHGYEVVSINVATDEDDVFESQWFLVVEEAAGSRTIGVYDSLENAQDHRVRCRDRSIRTSEPVHVAARLVSEQALLNDIQAILEASMSLQYPGEQSASAPAPHPDTRVLH